MEEWLKIISRNDSNREDGYYCYRDTNLMELYWKGQKIPIKGPEGLFAELYKHNCNVYGPGFNRQQLAGIYATHSLYINTFDLERRDLDTNNIRFVWSDKYPPTVIKEYNKADYVHLEEFGSF